MLLSVVVDLPAVHAAAVKPLKGQAALLVLGGVSMLALPPPPDYSTVVLTTQEKAGLLAPSFKARWACTGQST